ncbi:MAG: hypothetical protein BGP25_00045 [Lysobacterales bacterium 63-13]|nr:MAG: hypothetical protein BGP25_00045 [Xanthomonadales bacterium 63-13]
MAASLDLLGTAYLLLDTKLARAKHKIVTGRDLARLDSVADLTTFKGIAHLLLGRRPPDWLRAVVADGKLAIEFIPKQDLEAISWLGDDLEPIITSVYRQHYGEDDALRRKMLGDAGELAVMSAFRSKGCNPRHVALVSDRFGYDVELQSNHFRYGYEVKTAVAATASRILVSRHEFEVAAAMGDRWRLIQVTFSTKIFLVGRATCNDIVDIRELTSERLRSIAPIEPATFRWTETAEFRPLATDWSANDLAVGNDFEASLEPGTA